MLLREQRQHKAYLEERLSFEERAARVEGRDIAIHDEVLRSAKAQADSVVAQAHQIGPIISEQLKSLQDVNIITKAMASGSTENVESINKTLAAFE